MDLVKQTRHVLASRDGSRAWSQGAIARQNIQKSGAYTGLMQRRPADVRRREYARLQPLRERICSDSPVPFLQRTDILSRVTQSLS